MLDVFFAPIFTAILQKYCKFAICTRYSTIINCIFMGILKNFESWAHSDNNNNSTTNNRRGFEPWARPSHTNDYTRPSTNPATDVDDTSLYNPHSEYHNYHEEIDDVIDNDFDNED